MPLERPSYVVQEPVGTVWSDRLTTRDWEEAVTLARGCDRARILEFCPGSGEVREHQFEDGKSSDLSDLL